jgi:hypothetical protein
MEYTIASSDTIDELENTVNEMLDDGWEPSGGLTISHDGVYLQAMVRYDDELDEFEDYEEGEEL